VKVLRINYTFVKRNSISNIYIFPGFPEFHRTHFSKGNRVHWAFLPEFREQSDASTVRAYVGSLTAAHIYVFREEFADKLDELENVLTNYVTMSIQEKYPNYAKIFSDYYEVGMVVAVLERVDKKLYVHNGAII